jgi:hypothetical protein
MLGIEVCMNASRIVLKLVLDAVGQPLKLGTFDDRFMIQKKTYLTQLTGLDLSYRFGWYLRGPYSRELTRDAFRLKEQLDLGEEDYKGERLSPRAAKLAARAATIWGKTPPGIPDSDWLELLASLHFLKHIAYWPGGTPNDFDGILKGLVENKPRFKGRRADAQKAWDQLNRVGLLQHKLMPVA